MIKLIEMIILIVMALIVAFFLAILSLLSWRWKDWSTITDEIWQSLSDYYNG